MFSVTSSGAKSSRSLSDIGAIEIKVIPLGDASLQADIFAPSGDFVQKIFKLTFSLGCLQTVMFMSSRKFNVKKKNFGPSFFDFFESVPYSAQFSNFHFLQCHD